MLPILSQWAARFFPIPETDLSLRDKPKGRLWITPIQFLQLINAYAIADWALRLSLKIWPRLPRSPRGCPPTYTDASVLLTSIVAGVWQLGYEAITGWLSQDEPLALTLGYTQRDPRGKLKTISSSQLWRRVQGLGLGPYLLFFVGMVFQLLKMGVIKGWDVILDSSLLKAGGKKDPDAAWSYPTRWKGSIFGFKIHTLLCRWSDLPLFFFLTPANAADCTWAIPLLLMVVLVYRIPIRLVWADAAYFSKDIFGFIKEVLKASFAIDYNLRRKGKKYLATFFFIGQWKRLLRPRTAIERYFARLKRYFGLELKAEGLVTAWRCAFLANISMLAVAMIAHRYQRPDLALKKSKVLAITIH